jgi:hypothetical protein
MTTPAAERERAPSTAVFRSLLFGSGDAPRSAEEPASFRDLNLDQVVAALVSGRDGYDLEPFFYAPLRDLDVLAYRQEVFQDLEQPAIHDAVEAFAEQLRRVRRFVGMVETQRYRYERERWLLDGATLYHQSVSELAACLDGLELGSRGLRELRAFLGEYTRSEAFIRLVNDTRRVAGLLGAVRYTIRLDGPRITVAASHGEPDYGAEIERVFERFRQGDVDSHLIRVPDSGAMDHVEARIVELVARLYPEAFAALDAFCERHAGFMHELVARLDRELQFFLAYLEHAGRLRSAGVAFCYPELSTSSKDEAVEGGVDLALATKLLVQGEAPVPNDFALGEDERILVVSGPNNGGKTTFARLFGQLHYLAGLGVPAPARSARLYLPDRVFTHFERREQVTSLHGKLDDELLRLQEILERATADSVVVLNEIFASTTLEDAVFLGRKMLTRIRSLGCLGVCVTFVDELASLGPETASMVATVDPADPSRRTFRLVRRPADGLAHAWSLAAKYGLSYDRLTERLSR